MTFVVLNRSPLEWNFSAHKNVHSALDGSVDDLPGGNIYDEFLAA